MYKFIFGNIYINISTNIKSKIKKDGFIHESIFFSF
ncbi:DUF3955 domain-containing protein [Clostridium cadaveris]|uniref:DUF3955 domain-containing protein n=1 Tax=Clostridium cadaveris TaxID=1529 RepID=A0A316M5U7_9CLOT|nr:DUF3955 domain-containing protein [Clostridium cadaveris]PWL53604.1 MAG: DUF3955 domain-containing protein [Clostridium cadaveris]UFH66633.1 DUF3955 domain-containing protein [Clostridium cadaveris]